MKKFLLIPVACLFLFVTSCKKFLDKIPVSTATDQSSWKTEEDANSAVAGCYALERNALNNAMAFYSYGDLPADEFDEATQNGGDPRYNDVKSLHWNVSIPAANNWDPMWKLRRYDLFYKAIDQANRCIHYIPSMRDDNFSSSVPGAKQKELVGEAYFVRAFMYFYMARVWGDVPLVLETAPVVSEAPAYTRSKQSEVLAQCLKDIAVAETNLGWHDGGSSDRIVRADKGAVLALKAHIYAWMGDYANSLTASNAVINSGLYSYVNRNSYLDIFKGQSSEGIFEIAQNASNEGAGVIEQNIAFYTLKSPYLATNNGSAWFTLNTGNLYNLYSDTNDLRVKEGFAFFNSSNPITIKYSNITYMASNNTNPVALNNLIIFRLSDIVLLKAEALAATGQNTAARTILDDIRSMAGLTPLTVADADLFEAIIDERGRELFLEGHRFYDLIRLARKKDIYKFGDKLTKEAFLQGKYYWPLDPSLIQTNTLLLQTDYWKSRM